MMQALQNAVDRFFGRGRHSTSVPIMDGPLQPNQLLESAPVLAQAPQIDNAVTTDDGALLCSSGDQLLQLDGGQATVLARFDAPITCMATHGAALAVGVNGQGVVIRGGTHDGHRIATLGNQPLACPTAAQFADAHTLFIASGSSRVSAEEWKHDLMAQGRSGSVWRVDLASGNAQPLAQGLAFPYGLALNPTGALLVTEAWEHRIIEVALNGGAAPRPVLDELPAYPARLMPASGGGYWLACFAPRNPLIEFVLREPGYRDRMVAQIDPRHWIAPTLAARASHQVPMQSGGIRQMNILKPWAPSFSYGLVMRLDAQLLPVASWHSRADGTVHGVTSVCEHAGRLIATAKGPGRLVAIDISESAR